MVKIRLRRMGAKKHPFYRLVVADARDHPLGLLGVERLELLLKGGQPEEPVLLVLARERDQVDQARVVGPDLGLRLEVRAAGAVRSICQESC